MPTADATERDILDIVESCYADPLRFVMACYPWGEPGPLQNHAGPDEWQKDFLTRLGNHVTHRKFTGQAAVLPIRMAASSGHGIGKSVLVAWVVNWIMSTRPHCQGTITANTFTQLETKTWAAIQRWTKLCLTGHWFTVTSNRMYHPAHKESWFCAPQSCREENSEAFAGQHAADSTSFYVFDEDSAVPDNIHEVAEGGLTDGEPMEFRFGNPTRNTGAFYQACFGSHRGRWDTVIVDSRGSRFTNKALIDEWVSDYGEDSDFVRVRVRGLPPTADDAQFIDADRVVKAQSRLVQALPDEPLIAGVDVSGGGSAWTVCRFRRGQDARTIAPIRITGQATRDRNHVIALLAERLSLQDPAHKIAAMFIDSAFGSPIVERLHVLGYTNVHEVNFGGVSPNAHQANQRAYQWNRMKEWLLTGAIPKNDHWLESDLSGPGFHLNKKDQLVLESKESMIARGLASPDDGDALSLTFAQPVAVAIGKVPKPYRPVSAWG
jgi:hypothetical protein